MNVYFYTSFTLVPRLEQQQYGGQQYNHYGGQQYNPNAGNPMAYGYGGYGGSGYGGYQVCLYERLDGDTASTVVLPISFQSMINL